MCACSNDNCWGGCPCGCKHTGPERVAYYRDRRGFVGGPNPEAHDASAKPVVVLDPNSRKQVERLRNETLRCLRDHIGNRAVDECAFTEGDLANAMQAALRSLIADPRPEEPTGLGAVIDVSGELYVRDKTTTTTAHWKRARGQENGKRHRYDELCGVVRVLSDGVQP